MTFEIDRAKYIDTRLVTERAHPTEPLLIYNYTPECQYSRAWDETTLQCRGLIVHKDTREIIARPFRKFFNWEEYVDRLIMLPKQETPKVYSKLDGSLGILYWTQDGPAIATRGSFQSDQALWATRFLRERYMKYTEGLNRAHTYLFEIIYPENQIVVNYNGDRNIVLLAVIDTETGKSLPHNMTGFPFVSDHPFTSFEELKKRNIKNEEGYVLHYPMAELRVKIKFEDYVKLHKIMTGLSEIGIWEMLRDGKDVFEIIRDMPDEMHGWATEVIQGLLEKFTAIECEAELVRRKIENYETRKEQAEVIVKSKHPSVVFAMLDNKEYKTIIYKMIRPRGSSTFRSDIDA